MAVRRRRSKNTVPPVRGDIEISRNKEERLGYVADEVASISGTRTQQIKWT